MGAILETRDLGRWYGDVVGLNELTVNVGEGICGLVGPNGAGKSTLLKLIAGEIKPSRGEVRVLGEKPFANPKTFERLGFSPQQDAFYTDMSALDFVTFLTRLFGHSKSEARKLAQRALERVGMADSMQRRIAGYSKGMRQRTKLAQAIVHSPRVVVADEPLSGLDPVARHEVLRLFAGLAESGTSVIVSSHVLHEVESLTREILLLHRGRLLAQGDVRAIRELLSRHPRKVRIHAARPRELARELVLMDDVTTVTLGEDQRSLSVETQDVGGFYQRFSPLAAEGGFGIESMESSDAGLEAVFEYLIG